MTLLAAIGDITRFENARKLVGYSGLGAGVHASGQTHHSGRITKQGRAELRWRWWKLPGLPCSTMPTGSMNSTDYHVA
jgi:transposase